MGEECNPIHILEITLTGMWGLQVGIPARRPANVRVKGTQECKAQAGRMAKLREALEGKKMGREKKCPQPFNSLNNVLPVNQALQSGRGRFLHV